MKNRQEVVGLVVGMIVAQVSVLAWTVFVDAPRRGFELHLLDRSPATLVGLSLWALEGALVGGLVGLLIKYLICLTDLGISLCRWNIREASDPGRFTCADLANRTLSFARNNQPSRLMLGV